MVKKSNRKKYMIGNATEEDIQSMLAIEESKIGPHFKPYSENFFRKWLAFNSEMFLVLKDLEGNLLAFAICAPLTEYAYMNVINGSKYDMDLFNEKDVKKDFNTEWLYFSDICSSSNNKILNGIYSLLLISALTKQLPQNSNEDLLKIDNDKQLAFKGCIFATLPVTNEGLRLSSQLGFIPQGNNLNINDDVSNFQYRIAIADYKNDLTAISFMQKFLEKARNIEEIYLSKNKMLEK